MGRFSPTVRPEPFDLAGILDRLIGSFDQGRQRRDARDDRDTRKRERAEDRSAERGAERSKALAAPGAGTLASYLENPESPDLTSQSLRDIGNAGVQEAAIDFQPRKGALAGERAYESAPGVIQDPTLARQGEEAVTTRKGTLAAELQKSLMDKGVTPYKPTSREEQLQFEEDKARRTGLTTQRTQPRATPRPVVTLPQALKAIDQLYGTWDPVDRVYVHSMSPEARADLADKYMKGQITLPPPKPDGPGTDPGGDIDIGGGAPRTPGKNPYRR